MKFIQWMCALAVLAALAFPAAAEDWRHGRTMTCGPSGNDLRCVLAKDAGGDTATVEVTAIQDNVAFSYSSWHSTCGFPGRAVEAVRFDKKMRSSVTAIPVLDAGSNITCREIFISACTANGVAIPCSAAASAVANTFVGNRQ